MKIKFSQLSIAFISILASLDISAHTSGSLQEILRYALTEDPRILEAKANVSVAETQTKISEAGHYPIISVTNTQILSQRHKDQFDKKRSNPGLKGQVNLYSWGAIENEIERDRHKESFFKYKQEETKEQVGKSIAELYLTALLAKENIAIYKESLKRHQSILKNIQSIVDYDEGRAFEAEEAQSRLLQVESIIEQQSRVMHISLSRINRYTNKALTEKDLVEPFVNDSPDKFISRFKNTKLNNNPTYLAQEQELQGAKAGVRAAKAKLLPAVNLQGEVYRRGYEVYLGVSWNILDIASYRSVDQHAYTENAARAKLEEVLLELKEQERTSEIDMRQNSRRLAVTKKQINTQKKVVSSVELQFDIAQRSLLDVLNAYQELSQIQVEEANIKSDYRAAALNYLVSQAHIAKWAGVESIHLKF